MGKLSLGEAARVSGLSKPTISKYLKTGRISGHQRDDSVWEIDESEIVRLVASRSTPQRGRTPPTKAADQAAGAALESALAVEIRFLRAQVDDLTGREAAARGEAAEALARERALADRIGGLIEDQRKKGGFWARCFQSK